MIELFNKPLTIMKTFRDIPEDENFYRMVIYAPDGVLEALFLDIYSRPARSIDNIWDSSSFGEENGCENIHAELYADYNLFIERMGNLLSEFSERNGCDISVIKTILRVIYNKNRHQI